MPFTANDTDKYRQDVVSDGRLLKAEEREELLKVCTRQLHGLRPNTC